MKRTAKWLCVWVATTLPGCVAVADFADEGEDGGPTKGRVDGGRDALRDGTHAEDATVADGAQGDVMGTTLDAHGQDGEPGDSSCPGTSRTSCGGACVDLTSDVDNCGACGHACRGTGAPAACSAGLCSIETFATNQDMPSSVVVQGAKLYWTTATSVLSTSTASSLPIVTTIQSDAGPFAVTASDAGLFWTDETNVWTAMLTGGDLRTLATGQNAARGIAVTGSSTVCWANANQLNDVKLGETSVQTFESNVMSPLTVAASGNHVYFSAGSDLLVGSLQSTGAGTPPAVIYSKDAGALGSASSNIAGTAVDATQVYWTDSGGGMVTAAAMAAPYAIAWHVAGQATPEGIASDGTNVYWANSGGGTIVRAAATNGSSVTTLVTGQTNPWAVAVDGTHVYWVTKETNGGVYGVAK